jgi:hypothetical protein
MAMTNSDLLAVVGDILHDRMDRAKWLMLADAFEEAGDRVTALAIRVGSDPDADTVLAHVNQIEDVTSNGDSSWGEEAEWLIEHLHKMNPVYASTFANDDDDEENDDDDQ